MGRVRALTVRSGVEARPAGMPAQGTEPFLPPGAGTRAGRRPKLTSGGVSARRFSPRSGSEPDPRLWLPPRSGRGLRDPLRHQLPGLRRGSWGGGSATRTAPPPNPQEPMGARGCGARVLRGARALSPPTHAGKLGSPRYAASRVCSRPWSTGGLPQGCPLACNKV